MTNNKDRRKQGGQDNGWTAAFHFSPRGLLVRSVAT